MECVICKAVLQVDDFELCKSCASRYDVDDSFSVEKMRKRTVFKEDGMGGCGEIHQNLKKKKK